MGEISGPSEISEVTCFFELNLKFLLAKESRPLKHQIVFGKCISGFKYGVILGIVGLYVKFQGGTVNYPFFEGYRTIVQMYGIFL